MTTYTRDDLIKIRNECTEAHRILKEAADNAAIEGRIDITQYQFIINELNILDVRIRSLNTALINATFDSILLGEDSPGSKIKESTRNMEAAATRIDNIHDAIQRIAIVIDGLASVVNELLKRLPPLL
jgi:hypothetical protein